MNELARKSALGKGLDALFEDNSTPSSEERNTLRISEIEPNRNQPRKEFDQAALEQLADSIREHGVIQPLIVRPIASGMYQIVAGERRYRASRMVGLTEVPVVIRELSDTETIEIALIENLQREDLNPIEEALGYRELINHFNFTQETVSKSVGKSRPVIANALRLLNLPDKVLEQVRKGELSSGHARAILSFETEEEMEQIADKIIRDNLTVRDVERLSQKMASDAKVKKFKQRDSFYDEIEISLQNELGRMVKVNEDKNKKGTLVIDFYSKEDLQELGEQLTRLFADG